MKMLSFDEFDKIDPLTEFCKYHKIKRESLKNGWHDIIDTLSTKEKQYEQYKKWYENNFTKLAIYLRGNDASFKEDK